MFSTTFCRLCLMNSLHCVPLFNNHSEQGLPEKIMNITNIQIAEGDCMPDSVCQDCLYNVESSHRFKLLVEKSDLILREQLLAEKVLEGREWKSFDDGQDQQPLDFTPSLSDTSLSKDNDEAANSLIELATGFIRSHALVGPELKKEVKSGCISNDFGEEEDTHSNIVIEEIGEIQKPKSENVSETKVEKAGRKSSSKNVECPICHKTFLHKSYLPYHIKRHLGEKPFECHLCHARFTDKSNLKVHELGHLDVRPFSCDICKKTFKKKKFLAVHNKIHTGVKPHQCEICSKSFIHKNALIIHMKVHSSERTYVCKTCNKSYKQREGLRAHFMSKHATSEPMKCVDCGKMYQSKASLETHRKIAHCKDPPKFICEYCGKSFVFNGHLSVHRLVHASKSEEVYCDVCNKKCPHSRALSIHKKYVHSNSTHSCKLCGKVFKHNSTLKTHMVIHTGVRPHMCTYCNQSFTQKSALTNHMKVHTGIEPYQCAGCNLSFKWKQTYDKHISRCNSHRIYEADHC